MEKLPVEKRCFSLTASSAKRLAKNRNFVYLAFVLIIIIMKTVSIYSAIVIALICVACGSSWEISGNDITINRAVTPTTVPAGTLYILPDTVQNDSIP